MTQLLPLKTHICYVAVFLAKAIDTVYMDIPLTLTGDFCSE